MRDPETKCLSLEAALVWRGELRRRRRTLVFTNGCFDLMHRGHMTYLAAARRCGDALLVAMNSDASVAAIKGPGRPVLPQQDRAYMLASLEAVDAVVLFGTPNVTELLRQLAPEVYVKGGDYTENTLEPNEYRVLRQMGCRIELVPAVAGLSTTELIRRASLAVGNESRGGHREPRS